jgi:glycosyltransferase involved in cell wall biosynthesis
VPGCSIVRVAFVAEQCWHDVPGGTAVSAVRLADALVERGGIDLVPVSARHRRSSPPAVPLPVPAHQLPVPRLVMYELWHRLRRLAVERVTGPVDVIHATGMAIPPATAPLVVTIHDLFFRRDPSLYTRRGVSFFNRFLALTRREADLVLVPSANTADDCIDAGIDADRIRLVPLGTSLRMASDEEVESARDRHGLSRTYVMWAGTIEPRKNLRNLLAAFDRLADLDADLVLVGPQGWKEDLGPPGPNVRILGFVPEAERDALYRGATVFCLPSRWEGFGLPALEAMAQGTPVVVSAGTATAEIVAAAGVLVDPDRPAEIAAALRSIITDQSRRSDLAAAARARAEEFPWARCADLTVAAYAEGIRRGALVGRTPRAGHG